MGLLSGEEGDAGSQCLHRTAFANSDRHIFGWTPGYLKTNLDIPHMTKEH